MSQRHFDKDLEQFFNFRLDLVTSKNNSYEYMKESTNHDKLYDKLMNLLSEEDYQELRTLDESYNQLTAISECLSYRQGWADCLRMMMTTLSTTEK